MQQSETLDNENGFIEKAEYKNGQIINKIDDIPQWIMELKNYLGNNIF